MANNPSWSSLSNDSMMNSTMSFKGKLRVYVLGQAVADELGMKGVGLRTGGAASLLSFGTETAAPDGVRNSQRKKPMILVFKMLLKPLKL
ncbi:hypothetical protein AKJ16_DCAP10567 [Drosera capensis]